MKRSRGQFRSLLEINSLIRKNNMEKTFKQAIDIALSMRLEGQDPTADQLIALMGVAVEASKAEALNSVAYSIQAVAEQIAEASHLRATENSEIQSILHSLIGELRIK